MEWIQKILFYMKGRYGYDELSKALFIIGLLLGVLSNFIGGQIVSAIGIAVLAFGALRILSREKTKRNKELQVYLKWKQTILTRYYKLKNRWAQRKAFAIKKCPNCKQKVRVPRKNKKIRITCPSCQTKFIKKT
ncbi:hypothetical protein [Alkalibacterium iburiense]